MDSAVQNIFLIGFSATGKSKVAREVARLLGWDFVDIDDEIVKLVGKPIDRIFAEQGEAKFRQMESKLLGETTAQGKSVVATGGGIVVDPKNRELMASRGMVVCLEAKPKIIYHRLLKEEKESSSPVVRPLLAGENPLERIRSLKASRQVYYAEADWTIHTDHLTIAQVADEVVRGWQQWSRLKQTAASPELGACCEVVTLTQRYPIFIGWGILPRLGEQIRNCGLGGTAFVISDEQVFSIHGSRVMAWLRNAGFTVYHFAVPAGENSKTLETAARIYDFLVEHRAERSDVVVALGGGVVGDLAGFVASTFLRGLALVQVPTSLVAMVDAGIGGKVAVNHPQAKNLIGAFYQPRLVFADVQALKTLPPRELTSGWAELSKHALILDLNLFEFLENNAERLIRLETEVTTEAVRRSAAIKTRVVSEDEKETGKRTFLNYGHTIGHGLEAATSYGRLLHGEAVAIGMMGAIRISHRLGLVSSQIVERQENLLKKFGLPTNCAGVELSRVLAAMELDKKVKEKAVRWVLLNGIGSVVLRHDVPRDDVLSVLAELLGQEARK